MNGRKAHPNIDPDAQVYTAEQLQVGWWIETDRLAPPDDPDDYIPLYEEVVYIEELPKAFEIHTKNGRRIRRQEDELVARVEAPQPGWRR